MGWGRERPIQKVLGLLRWYGDLTIKLGIERMWGGDVGGWNGTEKSPKVNSLEDNDKFSISTEDRTRGNGLNFTAGGMAVRPQEELPGLEGSSEVIPSLFLPPGRTAPPPASAHTHRSLPKLALQGRRPPSFAPTPEPRGRFPSSGTFLRFNLDPLCCRPPAYCLC